MLKVETNHCKYNYKMWSKLNFPNLFAIVVSDNPSFNQTETNKLAKLRYYLPVCHILSTPTQSCLILLWSSISYFSFLLSTWFCVFCLFLKYLTFLHVGSVCVDEFALMWGWRSASNSSTIMIKSHCHFRKYIYIFNCTFLGSFNILSCPFIWIVNFRCNL